MTSSEERIGASLFAMGASILQNGIPWLLDTPTPSTLLIAVCRRVYGIKVVPYDSYDPKINGALIWHKGKPHIIYNCYLPEAHKTIAIGHELSHYIIEAKLGIKPNGKNRMYDIIEDTCTALGMGFVLPGGSLFKPDGKSYRLSRLKELHQAVGPWWELDGKEVQDLVSKLLSRLKARHPEVLAAVPDFADHFIRASMKNYTPFSSSHPHFRYF